jgi:spermidine synthase
MANPSARAAIDPRKSRLPFFIGALFVLGFGGIAAQTVLVRELLVLFSGNELSLGAIIGFWILAEAAGAFFAGALLENRTASVASFTYLTLLLPPVFAATIYLIRIFKPLLNIPVGMAVGLTVIFSASPLLLFPVGCLHGALFALSCALYRNMSGTPLPSAGRVYFYESAGTIIGGICVNYLLIPYAHSFQIAGALALLGSVACLPLLSFSMGRPRPYPLLAVFALLLGALAFLATNGAGVVQEASLRQAWQGRNIVLYENSLYQNITVMKDEDQLTFFSNGTPLVSSPVPDIVSVEEFTHFTLLAHPRPGRILVLGGGAGGVLNEVLKYPTVERVDYVEIDPALLRVMGKFPSALTTAEMADPRVHLHYLDGRLFVRTARTRYDAILLCVPPPSTLERNRFYTEEFFSLAGRVLKDDGILAFTLPGSLAYYSTELRDLNAGILATAGSAFPVLFAIPGDTNIYLLSKSQALSRITPGLLNRRLSAWGFPTRLITGFLLADRLAPRWRDWFSASMAGQTVPVNRDFHPSAVFYEIAYESLRFSPSLKSLFSLAKGLSAVHAVAAVALLFFVFLALSRSRPAVAIPFALAATGFAGMVCELMLLFAFQAVYGYVFSEIALLISAFMGGAALGSLFISRRLAAAQRGVKSFLAIEAAMTLFVALLGLLFLLPSGAHLPPPLLVHVLFLLLLAISGLFTGLEFPLANALYQASCSLERTVGLLYAADLCGGWLGGMLCGFFLAPLLGLPLTCLLLVLLKAASFLVVASSRKNMYNGVGPP